MTKEELYEEPDETIFFPEMDEYHNSFSDDKDTYRADGTHQDRS